MKIQFLHLSDLHIKNDSKADLKIDKIVSAVQSFGTVDKCILICSGDLAFSGTKNDYKYVRSFFGILLNKLGENKNQFIETYLVPGNHDMILPSDARNSATILEYYKKGKEDEFFNIELKSQDCFFEYAKSKHCFVNNKVLDSRIIDINGYKIQFNLLNTAPFSTLKADNKEIHYLPDSYFYTLIKKDNVNLSVTVMHHSTEWFHYKTKGTLEKTLHNYSDLVFQGHEHSISAVQVEGFVLLKGGEFSGTITHKSTFSVLTLDTDSNKCDEIEFEWDDENTLFCKKSNKHQFTIIPKTSLLRPSNEFSNSFFEDNYKISKNVLDYFVFPKLYKHKKSTHEEVKIITEETFWNELSERKIINISGKTRSGKTTLLKYFYNKSITKSMIPIYLGSDSYRSKTSIDKIIKNLFEEQYGEEKFLFEKYEQTEISKKILFIDDLDLIYPKINQDKLINMVKDKIFYIVFTSKEHFELDVKNAAKEEINESKEYYNINIDDFYKEKRNELITKICSLNEDNNAKLLNEIIEIIDHLVIRRHGLFELSPEYIVQYVKFFLNKSENNHKGEAVFNVIFETNIINAIIDNSKEKYVEFCLLTLEEIAFYMHKNKNEHISYQTIVNIIEEINKNRGLEIDIEKSLSVVINAKIFKKSCDNNIYEFSNRNYLAYFIARKLNKLIEKNGLGIPELNYIFKNICFGINDNILLFLSFLRDNTVFALNICNMLESIINDYPELDFDKSNISFINRQCDIKINISTDKEKKEIDKMTEDRERNLRERENEEIKFKNIYDYNENDADVFPNRIVKAIKYLEIISKSLISHYVNLELTEKNKVIELMYSVPNRILYALFKPYDQQYDKVIDELYDALNSVDGNETNKINRQDIEEIFFHSAISICLGLYDNVAFFGANSDTLHLLNAFNLQTSTNKIANLIMEENGGTTEDFVNKAIKLKENEDDLFITYLIRLITNKHLITRTIDFSIKDRIADTIFSTKTKKQVLISSYSKDKKKE
jgi:predicted phosphodiesterase